MKKLGFLIAPILACGLFFSACDIFGTDQTVAQEQTEPPVSPLAVLDNVDVEKAFGDTSAADWSFALQTEGDLSASYSMDFAVMMNGETISTGDVALNGALSFNDILGLRSSEEDGPDLFGGGAVQLSFSAEGFSKDGEPVKGNYGIGFCHDGETVLYADNNGEEGSISLSDVQKKIENVAALKTFSRMETAFSTIPEELQNGVSLRVAVEKLIAMGFTVKIDAQNGLAITLQATEAFYTVLINDILQQAFGGFAEGLPRADISFEKTVFDIRLAFDRNGLFKEYSMESDTRLSASLNAENAASFHCSVGTSGSFAVRAYTGEVPTAEELLPPKDAPDDSTL